ncbi:MAG TPA: hypothetical protein PKC69_06300 [Chitinophagaceae bacterium]|nr:hypothetical protein [Chitinophagaceae bacterium]
MYTGMIHLHSIFRWVILLLLLVAVFRHFTGMSSRRMVNSADQKIDLFLLISAHLTLVVGVYLWIVGPWGLKLIQGLGFGAVMKNDTYRFFAVEHLAGMLIAIILITVGRGAVKRATGWAAHKKAFWMFFIALLIILAVIPWPFRDAVARPYFPGM